MKLLIARVVDKEPRNVQADVCAPFSDFGVAVSLNAYKCIKKPKGRECIDLLRCAMVHWHARRTTTAAVDISDAYVTI